MEQVGPRAPLEQEMIRCLPAALQITIGGTAKFPLLLLACVLTPLFVSAHGTEFIMSRLRVIEDQNLIELRLCINYLGNPMIADEAAARTALQESLYVRHGEKTTRFTDLAPLTLESSCSWEDTLPHSLQPPDDGQPHQILIGTWRWKADAEDIFFTVAKGNRNDVLLWRQQPDGEVKSTMLLGGDHSPPIKMQQPTRWTKWLLAGAFVSVLMLRWTRGGRQPSPHATG
jgi:hypothetical protein